MFFSKIGEYEPCGIFTFQHIILLVISIIAVIITVKNTRNKNKEEVKNIIKNCSIILWIFEIIIIAFKVINDGYKNLNNYVPLYYCSLMLYAGILSSFCKGRLKRIGDVFIATGGIVGGLVFLISPTTSLLSYPMLHLVSIHSFIYHGIMLYLGVLVNITNYIDLEKNDIIYYEILVGIICILALIVNIIFGSNLMFISYNFEGTFIETLYNMTGQFFTPFMIIAQLTLPFFIIYSFKSNKKVKITADIKNTHINHNIMS